MARDELILIGPIAAGKGTLAELIAQQTGLPRCSMDSQCSEYYRELGFDPARVNEFVQERGLHSFYKFLKPYEACAVERLLEDHVNCVFDFGAGHCVFEDDALIKRVRHALAPFTHVVLLLPSPDERETIETLARRVRARFDEPDLQHVRELLELNLHFVRHDSMRSFATDVVYTNGKTPEESSAEVMRLVGLEPCMRSSAPELGDGE